MGLKALQTLQNNKQPNHSFIHPFSLGSLGNIKELLSDSIKTAQPWPRKGRCCTHPAWEKHLKAGAASAELAGQKALPCPCGF